MSAEELRSALVKMPANGPGSFEDLVARLLGELLGQRFVLSRSGSQPSGDARSSIGDVTIECKRYDRSKKYDEHRIEGQLRESIRTQPHLDLCVVAITTPPAQMEARLQSIENETGIDIFCLSYDGEDSDLITVCVGYWDIQTQIPALVKTAQRLGPWAEDLRQRTEFQNRLVRLRDSLRQRLHTYQLVRDRSRERLVRRFKPQDQPSPGWHPICLEKAVVREDLLAQFGHWWNMPTNSVCYLNGEEGVGKTWAAAQMANWLSAQGVLVLWLDNQDWFQAHTLDDVLRRALRLHLRDHDEAVERLVKKASGRWRQSMVLFLDGINERGAIGTSVSILNDLFDRPDPLRHLRFVFTARPAAVRGSRWGGHFRIDVPPYSDRELTEALQKLDPSLQPSDLPPGLMEIARIPRYLTTCARLRDRLGDLESVAIELVLWQDLLDRVESADHQVTERLQIATPEEAQELLSTLAQRATVSNTQGNLGIEELNACFGGNYEAIRRDLAELRLAETTRFAATLSPGHLVLGCALWILANVGSHDDRPPEDVAETVSHLLEPLVNNDRRTEAIYAATIIGITSTACSGSLAPSVLAGLMNAWIPSPNAQHLEARLNDIARLHPNAICMAIESLFAAGISSDLQNTLSASLVRPWRNDGSTHGIIRSHLERWLLLTLRSDDQQHGDVIEYAGHRLPKARNRNHLRLSALALSLFSVQPDHTPIRSLAIARATLDLSQEAGENRYPYVKDLYKNFRFLMRWAMTERVIEDLMRLVEGNPEDELVCRGARLLAADLALVDLAKPLCLPTPRAEIRRFEPWDPEEALREGRSILHAGAEEIHARPRIACLAIRSDLDLPIATDQAAIQNEVERLASNGRIRAGHYKTRDDLDFEELIPWYARLFPDRLPHLVRKLWDRVFENASVPHILATEIEPYLICHSDREVQSILQQACGVFKTDAMMGAHFDVLVARLTSLVAQIGAEENLRAWIDLLSIHPKGRKAATFLPLPRILHLHLSPDSLGWAVANADGSPADAPSTSQQSEGEPSQFEFWCYIASCVARDDARVYRWALDKIHAWPEGRRVPFHLWLLLNRSGSTGWFEEILRDPNLCRLIDQSAFRALWLGGDGVMDGFDPTATEAIWRYHGSLNLKAKLVSHQSGDDSLRSWGDCLVGRVYEALEIDPPPLNDCHLGEVRVNGEYHPIEWSTPNKTKIVTLGEPPASSWGVEEKDPDEFTHIGSIHTRDQEHEEAFQYWVRDLEVMRQAVGDDLFCFSGYSALLLWVQANPGRFLHLVQKIETTIKRQPIRLCGLGLLTSTVAVALLHVDPARARCLHEALKSAPGSIRVVAAGAAPLFMVEMWHLVVRGNNTARECALKMLRNARNDQEIMELTLAALIAEGLSDITKIGLDFLAEAIARERVLGISILAWLGSDEAIEALAQAMREDSSLWVREHATWATRVARGERCCRSMYHEALISGDAVSISAALMAMRPALTPIVNWWHNEIENDVLASRVLNTESETIRLTSWRLFESLKGGFTEVLDRKLENYCRGEELDTFVSPHMAPWWNVS